MTPDLVAKTKEFVKSSFLQNPHYSFDDWSVMYNHSVLVQEIALKIAEHVECDKLLVSIGALLHDIGKTHKVDAETLHKEHESFNLKVCEEFLESLKLPKNEFEKLKSILSYNSDSVELKIIKDADALALYADKRLYMLYIKWATEHNLDSSIKRKFDKFSKLNFEISKKIGKKWFEQMRKDCNKYLQKS